MAVFGQLHQLVDGVLQAVEVLLQQSPVHPLVSETHLQKLVHLGRALCGGWVDASLEKRRETWVNFYQSRVVRGI